MSIYSHLLSTAALELRSRRIPYGRHIDTSVSLQQTLVSDGEEWEPRQIVLIVDFHSFGETSTGITGSDQADEHTIHIDLIAVRRSSSTKLSAVGESRIDRGVDRENITGRAVFNGDRPAQGGGRLAVQLVRPLTPAWSEPSARHRIFAATR